ncbi:DUF222 domain-containing protein [Crossiella sp. CA-258035]|uniref:HNH endonuclease signature motif containing protein n=1 Tax=Crossiella sp. CA-258035 TaxID=2981138 RepID=UPI0024BC5826|nr:HNH endonuclease signature motif containing protein [Crossiella sp. CA-258035]WHT17311.1 DUF222 domain-containing protein [Crossiella sp. CA-258035]
MFEQLAVLDAPQPRSVDATMGALSADMSTLDDDALLDRLQDCQRIKAFVESVEMQTLARFAEHRTHDKYGIHEFVEDEIAAALGWSPRAAAIRLATALDLRRLPRTLDALAEGRIDYMKAKAITEAVAPLTGDQAASVEDRVLPDARSRSVGSLRSMLRRAVIRADPGAARKREEKAAESRQLSLWAEEDGMAVLSVKAPAPQTQAAFCYVDKLARTVKDEERTLDQTRTDVALDLLSAKANGGSVSTEIRVTVPITTLLGDDEPAELADHGPITAEMARELAMDANIKRLLTGPDGSVIGYDARRYKPPTWMTELVKARNPRCTFPGCRRKAHDSDLDHTIPHENGGPTSPDNLGPLCRHHHRLKQTAAWPWRLNQHPGGRFTWTSPTNRVYHTSPEPR